MSSGNFDERALLGERLARELDAPNARAQILELLLDPLDTSVTYRTALALLDRRDQQGLELIVRANAVADVESSQWLFDAVVQFRARSLGANDDFLRSGLNGLAQGPDQSVGGAVTDLLSALD